MSETTIKITMGGKTLKALTYDGAVSTPNAGDLIVGTGENYQVEKVFFNYVNPDQVFIEIIVTNSIMRASREDT